VTWRYHASGAAEGRGVKSLQSFSARTGPTLRAFVRSIEGFFLSSSLSDAPALAAANLSLELTALCSNCVIALRHSIRWGQ